MPIQRLLIGEQLLIQRARLLRDGEAFTRLVKIHQGRVRAFLVRLTRNHALADDLAQETFLKAYRKLDSFKGEGSFTGWLFRIAYHSFLEQRRSAVRRDEVGLEYQQDFEVLAERYESISTDQMDLEQALAQLPVAEAAAITLCFSYGFSHQEAAKILDIPLGTIKTNILRGKNALRSILDDTLNLENAS